MEQRKTIHFEIQCENSNGEWAELMEERPKTEMEIPELCDRARVANPRKNIRAVKVTTTVTVETICEEPRLGMPYPHVDVRELHSQNRVRELLQDCD